MRRWVLPGVLGAILAAVLWFGSMVPEKPAEDSAAVLDAVMDRLGVTQQTAVLSWLEADAQGEGAESQRVWISRGGKVHFHSYPLCGNMKAPVAYSLEEAEALGYTPCPKCWGLAISSAEIPKEQN